MENDEDGGRWDDGRELLPVQILESDGRDVIEGRMWFFDKHVFLLEEIGGDAEPRNNILETSPFWLRIYDLLIRVSYESLISRSDRQAGEVIEVSY